MIEFCSVHKEFAGPSGETVAALQGIDLEIAAGEVHALIGTSGCGKTTTLRLVNRLERPTRGEVRVHGEDVRRRDVIAHRRGIGYVIQSGGLFPHMTVAANVDVLLRLEGVAPAARRQRVAELLELVNLPAAEFAQRLPHELSGGQRQRVGIARALALDPDVLLMDEPFGALDPITRASLQGELQPMFSRLGKTVLLVTHDLSEAFALADRVSLMHAGRIVQTGSQQDLVERPVDEFVARFVAGQSEGHA